MDYETLTDEDKRLLLEDRLRGLESDHFRLAAAPSGPEVQAGRLEELETMIGEVKDRLAKFGET